MSICLFSRTSVLGIFAFFFFLHSNPVLAVRTITFYGAGDNITSTAYNQAPPSPSKCQIMISNLSGAQQTYTLSVDSSTAATGKDPGTYTLSTTPSGLALGVSQTINSSVIHTYTLNYPAILGATTGTQHVECNGSLVASDTTAAVGSLGFFGQIYTLSSERRYNESGTSAGVGPLRGVVPLKSDQN